MDEDSKAMHDVLVHAAYDAKVECLPQSDAHDKNRECVEEILVQARGILITRIYAVIG